VPQLQNMNPTARNHLEALRNLRNMKNGNNPGTNTITAEQIKRLGKYANVTNCNTNPQQYNGNPMSHQFNYQPNAISNTNNTWVHPALQNNMSTNVFGHPNIYLNPNVFIGLNAVNNYGEPIKNLKQFLEKYALYSENSTLFNAVKEVRELSPDYYNAILNLLGYFHQNRDERALLCVVNYPFFYFNPRGQRASEVVHLPIVIPIKCFRVPQLRSIIALMANAIINNYFYGEQCRFKYSEGHMVMSLENMVLMTVHPTDSTCTERWDWESGGYRDPISTEWLTGGGLGYFTSDTRPLHLAMTINDEPATPALERDNYLEELFLSNYTNWHVETFNKGLIDPHFVYLFNDEIQGPQDPNSRRISQIPLQSRNSVLALQQQAQGNTSYSALRMQGKYQGQMIPSACSADQRLAHQATGQVPSITAGFQNRFQGRKLFR